MQRLASPSRLLICFVLVLGAHGLAFLIPISKPKPATPLRVTLLPSPVDVTPQPPAEKIVQHVESPTQPDIAIEEAPVALVEGIVTSEPLKKHAKPTLQFRTIIDQTKHVINSAERNNYRSFSLQDHLPKKPPQFDRGEPLIQLAAHSQNRSSQNALGQATDLVQNSQGDSACWQQRGIPGEFQQWYRVPLSLCGHLE